MAQTGRRLTIYVPPDLAERLDRVKDKVNPSRASQTGLEAAIAAEEKKLGLDARKLRIVERLLQSEEVRTRVFRQGFAAGQSWAETVATWKDLRTVAQWPDLKDADEQIVHGTEPPPPGRMQGIAFSALLISQPNTSHPKVYVPDGVPMPPIDLNREQRTMWWRGIRRGVSEVYVLVKDTIEPPSPANPQKV